MNNRKINAVKASMVILLVIEVVLFVNALLTKDCTGCKILFGGNMVNVALATYGVFRICSLFKRSEEE